MDISKNKVKVFKALSDETRYAIAHMLAQHESLSCGEISEAFHLSQPALSHHFRKLIDAGVIIAQKNGTHMTYSLNISFLHELGIRL